MNGGFEFVIFGVPVRVQWVFLMTAAFLALPYLGNATLFLIFIGIVFVSVLLHELAHAAAYRSFGVNPAIVLQGFGGVTFGRSLPEGRHLVVSVVGPATNLLIGLLCGFVANQGSIRSPWVYVTLVIAAQVNIFWAIFNILPIMPLDGGNATNSLLSLLFRRDMTYAARCISIAVGAAAIVFLLKIQWVFAALFIGLFVFQNIQALTQSGPGSFRPTVVNAPKRGRKARRAQPPHPSEAPPPDRPVGAPPGPARGSSPIDSTGWQVTNTRRTFEQEIDTAVDALSGDQPELAAIAIDRARRLATTPDQHAIADQLQAEIMRRFA